MKDAAVFLSFTHMGSVSLTLLHVNTKNQTPSRILSMVVGAHISANIEIHGHTPNWNLSRRSVLSGRTVEMGRDNNAYETLCTVFRHIIY